MKEKTAYRAYLLTGSNLGNSIGFLEKAMQLINEQCGNITNASSYYKTAAWGFTDQPDFINQALCLVTSLEPEDLMKTLLRIELQLGRERNIKMGPRVIDIDILLIEGVIMNTDLLTVPHPHLSERKFALTPLKEIAASIVHPVEKKTVLQLLQDCKDSLDVQKIS